MWPTVYPVPNHVQADQLVSEKMTGAEHTKMDDDFTRLELQTDVYIELQARYVGNPKSQENLDEFAPPPLFQIFQRHYKFIKIQSDILSSFFVSSSQLPKSPWFIPGFKFLFEFAEIYEIFRYKSPPCYQRM